MVSVLRGSGFEIDGDDRLAEIAAQLRDGHVTRIGRVAVERRAIAEENDEAGVVRPRRADDVLAHFEVHDAVDVRERR